MGARVGVIGAGISGLAAARKLVEAGYEVEVFEASDRCGGVLGTSVLSISGQGDFMLEHAASSFMPAEDGASELAQELGLPLLEAVQAARKRWIYIEGQLQEVPKGPKQLLSSQLLSWRGKFRALAEPLQPTLPGSDESIADFCRRRLGDEVTRALIGPFIAGVFGGDQEELSLRACFPQLAELEARGGLVRGVAATKVESLLSRMQGGASAKRGRRIMAPVGGFAALMEALAQELASRIHYSTSIASLERPGHAIVLHDAQGQHHEFQAVVLATPAPVTASLVEPHDVQMAQALREIPYAPMAVVGLGFERAVSHPLDGFGLLVAKGERLRLLGAVFESAVWSGRAPPGGVVIRCMMGGVRDPEVLELSDEELSDLALADLKAAIGISETPELRQVIRWPRAIPQYTIGHLERARVIQSGAESLGLVVASNAIGGVSVNDCIAKAHKVVKQVGKRLAGATALLLVFSALMACGASNKKTGDGDDDGDLIEAPEEPADASIVAEPGLPGDRGKVQVMARWLWPPPEFRRSPGRNSCGVARSPGLRVELMGGLSPVVVSTEEGEGPSAAQLFVEDCTISPRLVVIGTDEPLYLQNLDEFGHELVVELLSDAGVVLRTIGTLPMRVVGQRFAVRIERPGIIRVHSSRDPMDYAYAIVSSGAAEVTDERGMADFELPVGSHELTLWHPPPTVGAAGLSATLSVDVQAQTRSKHIVDLKR